jgi:hypothetical protein
MSRLIGRLTVGCSMREAMTIYVRREGSELIVRVAGASGIALSHWYANPNAKPPAFAAGTDAEALAAVARWSVAGGNPVLQTEAAPPSPPPALSDEYRRGLEAALALCDARPTAHSFEVAAEIRALLGKPVLVEPPVSRRRRSARVGG